MNKCKYVVISKLDFLAAECDLRMAQSSANVPLCEVNEAVFILLDFLFSTEIKDDNIHHIEMCCGN